MGYRSEICFCLSQNGKKAFCGKLEKEDLETQHLVKDLLDNPDKHFLDPNNGSELWYWKYIKWYFDYKDVKFIEDQMCELPHEDYHFVRVGDDLEDNEDNGSFENGPIDFYISRSIHFDPPMEK